ncbi:microtubule-associated protein, RP/EB family [Trypanosoma rangeli]|uniref:Microtubule-associated protein, RP/EB family n=1 Tax=Trypanosoma rangeli TaxID=5698 RepID=A0A422NQU0_TRYRA|nr:microtubule-associated protein, RP/EB family [Trypanosoma rangeli]RNF07825.1 microtubule-associated protein, RP/EB family [Trypanosoma rangeli]|eukprot:RNF07825.1 microtubule-associated protein, RP/EB family [Trypanosoma rangeli]
MDRPRAPPSLQVVASKASRTELLAWLNELLHKNAVAGGHPPPQLHKVEHCSNGVPYVLLLPFLLPTAYPPLTAKAKTNAKHEFDAVVNLKLLVDALHKNGIPRPDVLNKEMDKVIKGAYQANLQLLQWFRGLYDALSPSHAEQTQNTLLGGPAELEAAPPPPPPGCEGSQVELETTMGSITATTATVSGRVRLGRLVEPAAFYSAHKKEAVTESAPATSKVNSSFNEPGNAIAPRPLTAEGRQAALKRCQVSQGRSCSNARGALARERPSSTVRTSSRGGGVGAPVGRLSSSLMRSSNTTKRTEGGRDPELEASDKASCAESATARPNSAGCIRQIAAPLTATSSHAAAAARAPLRRSGVCLVVDSGSPGLNGVSSNPIKVQKRAASSRSGADSPTTSALQSGPTGLFQSSQSGTPPHSFRRPGLVSEGRCDNGFSLSAALTAVKNERQFYYDKLRQIENLVGPLVEQNEALPEAKNLARSVLEILYAVA